MSNTRSYNLLVKFIFVLRKSKEILIRDLISLKVINSSTGHPLLQDEKCGFPGNECMIIR